MIIVSASYRILAEVPSTWRTFPRSFFVSEKDDVRPDIAIYQPRTDGVKTRAQARLDHSMADRRQDAPVGQPATASDTPSSDTLSDTLTERSAAAEPRSISAADPPPSAALAPPLFADKASLAASVKHDEEGKDSDSEDEEYDLEMLLCKSMRRMSAHRAFGPGYSSDNSGDGPRRPSNQARNARGRFVKDPKTIPDPPAHQKLLIQENDDDFPELVADSDSDSDDESAAERKIAKKKQAKPVPLHGASPSFQGVAETSCPVATPPAPAVFEDDFAASGTFLPVDRSREGPATNIVRLAARQAAPANRPAIRAAFKFAHSAERGPDRTNEQVQSDFYGFFSRSEIEHAKETGVYLDDDEIDVPFDPRPISSKKPSDTSDEDERDERKTAEIPVLKNPRARNRTYDSLDKEALVGEDKSITDAVTRFHYLPGTESGTLRIASSLLGPETGRGVFNMAKISAYQEICEYGGVAMETNKNNYEDNFWSRNEFTFYDPIRQQIVIGDQNSYGCLIQDSLNDERNNCIIKWNSKKGKYCVYALENDIPSYSELYLPYGVEFWLVHARTPALIEKVRSNYKNFDRMFRENEEKLWQNKPGPSPVSSVAFQNQSTSHCQLSSKLVLKIWSLCPLPQIWLLANRPFFPCGEKQLQFWRGRW